MKTASNTLRFIIPIFALALSIGSCNKGTDLVADYALADTSDALIAKNLVTDDSQNTSKVTPIVLEIISNNTVAKN